MKILVTNDDGIFADGLWTLARELKSIAQVFVVAPDREQSAVGTSVTLWQPLRIRKVKPPVPEIETYAVEGTPSDSVILALGNLIKGGVDLVVSGINHGLNLGDDVHISGTVSAALQGYLHGLPTLAISTDRENTRYLDVPARLTVLLAKKIASSSLPPNLFLNVNVPNLPVDKIGGVQITQLADASHINTVDEGHDGKRKYYWLVRQSLNKTTNKKSDVWAVNQGKISITPLFTRYSTKFSATLPDNLGLELFRELKNS
jgi:5'-nucleotidase